MTLLVSSVLGCKPRDSLEPQTDPLGGSCLTLGRLNWKLSHLRNIIQVVNQCNGLLYQSNHDYVSDRFVLAIIETFSAL